MKEPGKMPFTSLILNGTAHLHNNWNLKNSCSRLYSKLTYGLSSDYKNPYTRLYPLCKRPLLTNYKIAEPVFSPYSVSMVAKTPSNKTLTGHFLSDLNDVKGRLAESFVSRLFKRLKGFRIFEHGVETRFPELAELVAEGMLAPDVIQKLRRLPDFCILRKNQDQSGTAKFYKPMLAEVKFRQGGMIKADLLKEYQEFGGRPEDDHDIVFLLFDRKGVYCLDINNIDRVKETKGRGKYEGEYVVFKNCPALSEHPAFHFSSEQKKQVKVFEQICAKVFGGMAPNTQMQAQILNWLANSGNQNNDDLIHTPD